MKRKFLLLGTILLLSGLFLSSLFSTVTAKTDSSSPFGKTISEEVKKATVPAQWREKSKKIQEIKEKVKEKAKEKVRKILSERKRVGWLGVIRKKTATSLTIETRRGLREVLFTEETKIVNLRSQPLTLDDLTEGKRIVALGYRQSEKIMEAKRIIATHHRRFRKRGLVGKISDKSSVEKLLVVTPIADKDNPQEIVVTERTRILNYKNELITYDNLQKGNFVAVIYKQEENNEEKTALIIKVIRRGYIPSPSPSPTP
ncbi:hypothetical protein J7J95_01915 [bacterium]|nr:hypothetical protein [bacterium]